MKNDTITVSDRCGVEKVLFNDERMSNKQCVLQLLITM